MKFLLLSLPILAAGSSSAATIAIVGTPGATSGSAILPSAAGTDWGLWSTNSNPAPATASITSTAGTRTFAVATVGGTGAATRGSGSAGSTGFTFTNGDTTPSGSGSQVGGIFNSAGVGTGTLNTGVALTLTDFTTPVRIQLYTYVFQAAGTLNVYLDGSTSTSYTGSFESSSGGKPGYVYTFDYVPDSTSSTVRFEHLKTASNDAATSNVGFLGISITPIPEPSSVTLLGTAGMVALLRRRRS